MAIKFLSDVLGSGELESVKIEATDNITIGGSSDNALTISSGDIIVGGSSGTTGQVLTSNGVDNGTSWTNKTTNSNDFLTALSFNTSSGVLTATVANQTNPTVDLDGRYLQLGGGTMTGNIVITSLTTNSAVASIGTIGDPIANIYATNVSANLKGTIASTTTATTATIGNDSTLVATTAFVADAISEIPDNNTTYDLTTTPTGTGLRLDPSTGTDDDITFTGSGGLTITRNSDTQLTFNAPSAGATPTLDAVTTAGSTTANAVTVGTITNNGSITTTTTASVGTNLTVFGNSSLVSLDVGGGFGSTGATISAAGNVSTNGNANISGTLDVAGDITLANRFNLSDSGVMTWGNSNNYGKLNWDGDYALISGQSSKGIKFQTNGSNLALTLDTSQNATFAGTIDTGANSITTTGTVNAGTFSGDLNGTINTLTTATTQSASNNTTLVATTAYVDTAIGTIPSGLAFEGNWNANTDTPDLSTATPSNGQFYIVSVAGNTDLDGITDWKVGDWAIYVDNGAGTDAWQKIDNTSTLSGFGSANKIAKWTATASLADSTITDDGTDISIGGDLTVTGGNFKLGSNLTTTVGKNLLKIPDISSDKFIRLNADESVSSLSGADFRNAIGAGTSSTVGTVTGVTGTSPINSDGSSTSPAISINTADASTTGALTSTDWNTFNGKTSNTGTVTSSNGSNNEIAVFTNGTNIEGDENLKYGTVANQFQLVDGTSTIRIGTSTPGYIDIGNNSIAHHDGTPSGTFYLSSTRSITLGVPADKGVAFLIFDPVADVSYVTLQTTTNDVKWIFSQAVDFENPVDMQNTATALTATLNDNSTNVATTAFVFANAITGSGTSGRIPYFDGTKSITSESPLAYNATDNRLELVGQVDFRTTTTAVTGTILEEAPAQNMVSGEIVFLGNSGSSQAGRAYILQSDNTWIGVTDNNEPRASGMVALAIGTDFNEGMLLRGFARFQGGTGYASYSSLDNTGGAKIYVGNSTTHSASGNMTSTLNITNNQFVRILGYSTGTNNNTIYFNPDKSYIENGA